MKKIIILIIILAVIGYFYSIYDKAKKTIDADDNASKYKVGDTIFFGQYLDKHDDEEKSPIQWIVLQVDEENNRILVVSKYAIDGVNEEVLNEKFTFKDVPQWDSVAHLSLISELEEAFDVMFEYISFAFVVTVVTKPRTFSPAVWQYPKAFFAVSFVIFSDTNKPFFAPIAKPAAIAPAATTNFNNL